MLHSHHIYTWYPHFSTIFTTFKFKAFVNQLGTGADAARLYLVQFINHSRTGFIVAGVASL